MSQRAAFVAPLPPPVNGFSNVSASMLERLQHATGVEIYDRAPGSHRRASILWQLCKPFAYATKCLSSGRQTLYVALSGGLGQILDLMYVLIGRLFRHRIFIHHHSYAYINKVTLVNACLFALVRNESHIVLSRGMGAALQQRYRIKKENIRVVSNAAFFGTSPQVGVMKAVLVELEPAIRIGFLANITHEKGFVEFFEILKNLRTRGVHYKAFVAGPLAAEARIQFYDLMQSNSDVEYVGPVYGEAKDSFYQKLDIFVFPTKYPNEAEPLVLYEAMNAGVYVIACERGAIAEMLENGAGTVLPAETVAVKAADLIWRFSIDPASLLSAKKASAAHLNKIRVLAAIELNHLLESMLGSNQ